MSPHCWVEQHWIKIWTNEAGNLCVRSYLIKILVTGISDIFLQGLKNKFLYDNKYLQKLYQAAAYEILHKKSLLQDCNGDPWWSNILCMIVCPDIFQLMFIRSVPSLKEFILHTRIYGHKQHTFTPCASTYSYTSFGLIMFTLKKGTKSKFMKRSTNLGVLCLQCEYALLIKQISKIENQTKTKTHILALPLINLFKK